MKSVYCFVYYPPMQVTIPPGLYIYMSLEVFEGFWVCKVDVVVGLGGLS